METEELFRLNKKPLKVKSTRSNNYREVTMDRVVVGIREGYFIFMIQNGVFDTNNLEEKEEEHFIDEVLVRLSPQQMVKMHKLFGQIINQYERIHGEIKTLEQIAGEKPDLLKDPSSES